MLGQIVLATGVLCLIEGSVLIVLGAVLGFERKRADNALVAAALVVLVAGPWFLSARDWPWSGAASWFEITVTAWFLVMAAAAGFENVVSRRVFARSGLQPHTRRTVNGWDVEVLGPATATRGVKVDVAGYGPTHLCYGALVTGQTSALPDRREPDDPAPDPLTWQETLDLLDDDLATTADEADALTATTGPAPADALAARATLDECRRHLRSLGATPGPDQAGEDAEVFEDWESWAADNGGMVAEYRDDLREWAAGNRVTYTRGQQVARLDTLLCWLQSALGKAA